MAVSSSGLSFTQLAALIQTLPDPVPDVSRHQLKVSEFVADPMTLYVLDVDLRATLGIDQPPTALVLVHPDGLAALRRQGLSDHDILVAAEVLKRRHIQAKRARLN